MARPREFDEDDVLERALEVFWSKGFDGASIEDLTLATGLSRASLYGAFDDKEGLFQATVRRYQAQQTSAVINIADSSSACQWIRDFIVGAVDRAREGPTGCFIQLSLGQCGDDRDDTKALLLKGAKHTEMLLRAAVTQAKSNRELRTDTDVATLVTFLMVLIGGLAAAARNGVHAEHLRNAATEGLRALQCYAVEGSPS
jgi:AcrR family transcriptional regulator